MRGWSPLYARHAVRQRRRAASLAAVAVLSACAGPGARDSRIDVAWTIQPEAPSTAAPVVVRLTVTEAGAPVRGAALRVEAHMAHPGMQPVVASVTEPSAGTYEARLRFTMAGDWILVLDGELADGTRVTRPIDVRGVRPAAGEARPAGSSP